ncbi:hypothetical protein LTR94_021101 [Friedmanniomyces endolithicus]|nr:hypothetical protein LTR94_021101 [Friedmanniomyces endolithicus]
MTTSSNSSNPSQAQTSGMWGGRFSEATDAFVAEFTASVQFDQRFYKQDIAGSIAHATMLAKVGVLTEQERDDIINGLNTIQAEIEAGQFQWRIDLEDVHMNIESRLTQRIGITGKKLHTGRSRNDQVATDIRLYVRDEIDAILELLKKLQKGSAALAGTTYPIDRAFTAELLGFEAVSENSLDAVSDRDFGIEFNAAASLIMMHLSRMSEELILWTSAQFKFVNIPDRFCTGSSIMPQKKNPDVPELVRGKTGRVYGDLMSLLTLMKGQPLAYNKDNQEDKEPLFDAIDTVRGSLMAFADMIPALVPNIDIMREAALRGFSTATDLADYLVKNGVAFRDAHEIVGKAVALGVQESKDLSELTLEQLQQFSDLIQADVFEKALTLEASVNARNHIGGTAPAQVEAAIERAHARLEKLYAQ